MNLSKYKIPSILGVFFLVAGVVAGVVLVQREQIFRLGAAPESAPQDVRITNVTDDSFTVNWITDRETIGFLNWGESNSLSSQARQVDNTPKQIHSVTVRGLSANSTYFFSINSGGEEYLNSGIPWSLQTGPSLGTPSNSLLVSGIITRDGVTPLSGGIVYVSAGGAQTLSTLTGQDGSFVIPLSAMRTATGTNYTVIDPSNTLLELFVQGGSQGVASAQTFQAFANPLPMMQIGQVYDFRNNLDSGNSDGVTNATLELPEDTTDETSSANRFGEEDEETNNRDIDVTLESITESGEVVSTNNPEFFGEGTPGTEFTITVESDPITDTVAVPSSGIWRWSPPDGLPDGEHTVTLSWRDAQGFLRTITRTFIVQAADGDPAFESTPSGTTPSPSPTVRPTATPTSSPSPTASPTPSPTISPTPTPSPTSRVSVPATDSGMPVAGSLTPTLLLATMGIGLFVGGIYISMKASS